MHYTTHFSTKETPQSERIPGSSQVENSTGGFSWAVDDWMRLDRFLVLGSEGGSYYASERKLTVENAEAVMRCIVQNGVRVVQRIVEVSDSGRAPKNDPALFALAMVAGTGNPETRKAALAALPKVARIGTHLFTFAEYVQAFRGWGRGLRTAIGNWYTQQTVDDLAYQLVKYRQRNGWSHRDLLRLAHPKKLGAHDLLFQWVTQGKRGDGIHDLVEQFARLQETKTEHDAVAIIEADKRITWEMVPTKLLGSAKMWNALLPHMPLHAMIRNLGRMSANGLLKPMSVSAKLVGEKLANRDQIVKSRLHPIAVLTALHTYKNGRGNLGKLEWEPVESVCDALDDAFYAAFGNVEPSGKRMLLALDVSGSMSGGAVAGVKGLTPRIASVAMAMVTARTEPQYHVMAFANGFVPLTITKKETLDAVMRKADALSMDGTDCALPMLWALKEKISVDTFVVYTDSETWAGNIHPSQALAQYRNAMQIPAKLVVVGMVSNGFTVADPNDRGMLDVVGFDIAAPNLITNFAKE
ncbi:MAG: TROVE domain-containing protein [Candidatus Eisenbacteria bacterium]|nr:TROVE domain-containing protein [Candidatus Eisenbacteria bacterium]